MVETNWYTRSKNVESLLLFLMKKKVPGDDLKHYPVLLEEYSFADFFAE
jgi:hypothetical protein